MIPTLAAVRAESLPRARVVIDKIAISRMWLVEMYMHLLDASVLSTTRVHNSQLGTSR